MRKLILLLSFLLSEETLCVLLLCAVLSFGEPGAVLQFESFDESPGGAGDCVLGHPSLAQPSDCVQQVARLQRKQMFDHTGVSACCMRS